MFENLRIVGIVGIGALKRAIFPNDFDGLVGLVCLNRLVALGVADVQI
jgi:hypothetical protein